MQYNDVPSRENYLSQEFKLQFKTSPPLPHFWIRGFLHSGCSLKPIEPCAWIALKYKLKPPNQESITMNIIVSLLLLCGSALAREDVLSQSAAIFVQAISSSNSPITLLAEITYDPLALSSELSSFEVPDTPDDATLLRVGIYDTASSQWKSPTSVTSAEMFAKGYAPTIVLSLDAQGDVIGVSLKAGSIDAGQTRDFGPRIKLLKMGKAKVPSLNKSKTVSDRPGAVGEEEVTEKTFLQKYWWMILGIMVLALSGGGAEEKKS